MLIPIKESENQRVTSFSPALYCQKQIQHVKIIGEK